ncbi:hypothetical protein AFCA_000004 [Aspergillus flavus]|uniref:C2H2-type domain-containing protein n=2 Tax=Aspergillus subgen. Circumdati TaxID=2720871 RepID=A0A1S9D611_ASPOZ|nr:Protein of unknown function DUF3505 [Aspergillus oryzae]RMZ38272.1 telomere-associated RecQ helicase [Aspergillus flavus]UCK57065.1 hypothetical protein AFCA_000004 [Aspergillus flavus]
MDLFVYNETYCLWICTSCHYAVTPQHLDRHLRTHHRQHPSVKTAELRQAVLTEMLKKPWIEPRKEPSRFPSPDSPPIPHLPIYSGLRCPRCSYIGRSSNTLRNHLSHSHPDTRRPRGRDCHQKPDLAATAEYVSCQRFYIAGTASHFFAVMPASQTERIQKAAQMSKAEFIQSQINQAYEQDQQAQAIQQQSIPIEKHSSEVSPWMELTRWPEYLQGQNLVSVAPLGSMPDSEKEPLLAVFVQSVERLIHRAYQTIASHRINEFDQIQINTFFRRPGVWNRPIQIHLRPSTYRQYRQVWQRLICFAYRSSRPDQPIVLRHQLTTAQLAALDQMEEYGTRLLDQPADSRSEARYLTQTLEDQLDEACLALSIALLDHSLKGDLFESTVVGFLAILGINTDCSNFRDPNYYTTYLSALVKIAQMLVAERAVEMADHGEVGHPADALDEMRERFLLYGVRAPFGWITRLRTYGKKIQNTTTSLGYIYWSDDEQTLSYKELQLSMKGFRQFTATQVQLAQDELEQLFLLHPEEIREEMIPSLPLRELQDDPTNNQRGWNFLHDPRNQATLSQAMFTTHGRHRGAAERWLLDRVLTLDWLREEFLDVRQSDSQVIWQKPHVDHYLKQVEAFLQRLLLLIHITGGQPGRATELLSLRHSNTVHGRHRNIFIEHGLVSTVTTYHKGYSISNTTKIIHRYLPKPVSELVVYYLWLILPFCQALQRQAFQDTSIPSAFLWPSGEGCWDSSRLRMVLQREAKTHLQTKMNITSYRHAAIAISRVHLQCGGFKRDYGADDTTVDHQASHGSWVAGTVYARGLQEAPGHIEARRRQYRTISRKWHSFLGFETYLGPRKRSAENTDELPRKRQYIMLEMDRD